MGNSVQEQLGFQGRYPSVLWNRRNYAALLYAALSHGQNVGRFLSFCNVPVTIDADVQYYFEYAFLRDLWNTEKDNEKLRSVLRSFLKVGDIETIVAKPIRELNGLFVESKSPSEKWVQSPGRWSVTKIDAVFPKNGDFLAACKFK
jgi:D-hexose-6-phosphate mutarotase